MRQLLLYWNPHCGALALLRLGYFFSVVFWHSHACTVAINTGCRVKTSSTEGTVIPITLVYLFSWAAHGGFIVLVAVSTQRWNATIKGTNTTQASWCTYEHIFIRFNLAPECDNILILWRALKREDDARPDCHNRPLLEWMSRCVFVNVSKQCAAVFPFAEGNLRVCHCGDGKKFA